MFSSSLREVAFTHDDDVVAKQHATSSSSSGSGSGLAVPSGSGNGRIAPVLSAMEQLMLEEERRKAQQLQTMDKQERKDYWLHVGIVVKVLNKRVAEGRYYKEKGTVERVVDRYVAEVRLADGVRLRLDQQDLETVIPKVSGGKGNCHNVTLFAIILITYRREGRLLW